MHQQLDRYDWRRADRFEPSVLLTTAIGIFWQSRSQICCDARIRVIVTRKETGHVSV